MARRTFFSFHYANDVWRANVVRNSWVIKDSREADGFTDAAEFEAVQRGGDSAIKKWIDNQLIGTSVTVVLIGSETNSREYVKYELQRSYERGNGLLGIHIHNIKNQAGSISMQGSNQFGSIGKDSNGKDVYFSTDYTTYDWVVNNGYTNIGTWIEYAARVAGK